MRLPATITARTAGALCAVVAALSIAGCGDDSSAGDSTTTTTTTTADPRAEFIAAADRLCTETGAATDAAVQRSIAKLGNKELTSKDVGAIFERVTLPALDDLYQGIGELTPPEGDAEEVDAILAAADQALREAKEDPEGLVVPEGGSTPFDKLNQLQQDFGFEVCGAPG